MYLQTYNAENRISSISRLDSGTCTAPGDIAAKWDFAYDGDGVRTSQLYTPYSNGQPQTSTVTRYYFGGALETSGSTVKKYYSFAGQTIAMKDSEGLEYFLTDHLGSIMAILGEDGTLINEQRYLPFGAVRTDVGSITQTDFGYTGQRKLDSGMGGIMDYKARFYSPYIYHFVSPDTIIPEQSQGVQAWNRYAYVSNNPVRYDDPTGHCPTCLIGAIGGAIALTAVVAFTHPDLAPQEYVRAALVGATAGLLIGTGVGIEAGGAIAAAYVGAGIGGLTAAGAYTLTAGDSYDGQEMAANAAIGEVTGAATALIGPEMVGTEFALIGRAAINGAGAQISQIVHNEYFDDADPSYPPPSESTGAAMAGGLGSVFGEAADWFVTTSTGSKLAGSLAYNTVKNLAVSIQVNRALNYIDDCDDKGVCR